MNTINILNLDDNYYQYCPHSTTRASQRGITDKAINLLLKYGSVIRKQGLLFHYITKQELKYIAPKYRNKLKNLVAIMAKDRTIITCYKNENAIKKIKRKSKFLK